jgi:hypothetical protein
VGTAIAGGIRRRLLPGRAARLVDGASEVHNMVLARFLREEHRDFWSWNARNRI